MGELHAELRARVRDTAGGVERAPGGRLVVIRVKPEATICVMRPQRSTSVISTVIMPAPDSARLLQW